MNKRFVMVTAALIALSPMLAACQEDQPSNRSVQADKAAKAAQAVQFDDNAEIDNIQRRLKLTADPGKLGFILLMNQAGQPIMYEGVKGKVTSGSKRLTRPDALGTYGTNGSPAVRQAPSDEGTYGSSSPYIFYWNVDGVYRQWDGNYLYSDQPIRTRVEPLVINVQK
jgi:hypothetical protein